MLEKNIKVSEIVHEELALRKRKDEAFDDVMKRELGILPSGIGDLVAFYPDQHAWVVREIIDLIEDQADFDTTIAEQEEYYTLDFDHPDSGHTIVQAQFREDPAEGMEAFYRDHHGNMQTLVEALIPEEFVPQFSDEEWAKLSQDERERLRETHGEGYPVYVGPTPGGHYEDWETGIYPEEDLVPRLQSKISGSYERWG